jgi:F-type H+-transporting ATPase subunit b
LSVIWVIVFVLLLTVVLDRLLFRPLLRVMEERQRAISSARDLAERSANEARIASAEFERRTAEARAELYRQMDEMRRTAMAERAAILERTRAEAEAEIAAASAQLQVQAEEARRRLSAEADTLGAAVAERILGRKAS